MADRLPDGRVEELRGRMSVLRDTSPSDRAWTSRMSALALAVPELLNEVDALNDELRLAQAVGNELAKSLVRITAHQVKAENQGA